MNSPSLLSLAVAAALTLASTAARAADVSPDVRRALAGGARIPVLVTLRPAPGRRPAAQQEFVSDGLEIRRRLGSAPVVAGEATAAGVAALAARPDVLFVGLDRVVRPAGQVSTAQIGADRLLAIGVTGLGRSVAVVDSGIDLTHPDLRGPGGAAWPGANLVDGDGDLSDCSGHGTEVAGVLAGPQGLAPEAGLVVLKVFSARDGCKSARASDVLAAVEWAVAHAPGTDLDAINLSLADDAPHAGFCDAEDPAGAAVFAAARAAGLSVAAAAGNEGRTTGLPWPACLSGVASVGMVYSQSSGPVQWGGAAGCTDATTGPDVIPCASNTGSALSVLAPGVGWTTTAQGGGQTSAFSGTSAAAPAAAGALLLARQARPLADPAAAIELLRATGVPVRDSRTGRTAPRLDLGAALAASTPVAGGCEGTPIPDGAPEGLTCAAVVSSFVGNVSTLFLALEIDHPDPTQLVVTLVGPDGTQAVILAHGRRPGEAVREIYGLTAASFEPLSSFAGRTLEGTWRLTVADTVSGGAGRLVRWALFVEPSIPEPEPDFPGATSFVATSAHRIGKLGAFYTTDVRLFNTDPFRTLDVRLRFSPAGGGAPRTLTVTLPPLATRALEDAVHDTFRMEGYGPLFLSAPPGVVAASRTSTTAPRGGSFGLSIPAEATATAAGAGATLVLVPCFKGAGFRINVGVTEVSGQPAAVEFAVRDSSGTLRALIPRAVPAAGLVQVNDVYALTHLAPDAADRIEVRVTAGPGRVAAWATPVDDSTNDGSFVSAHPASSSLLIPAVARASGQFGARFVTDLKVSNAGPDPVTVRIAFSPLSGPGPAPAFVALRTSQTRVFDDVLATLFGAVADTAGALRVSALEGGSLYASSRTSTTTDAGRSYGLAIDAAAGGALAGPGRQLALTFLSSSAVRRTNVGFVETAGLATRVTATLLAPDGTRVATRDLALDALGAVQWNDVFAEMGAAPLADASLVVDVDSGGSVAAYAILVDNRTNDASYFPASLVPTP
ncbi:MAG: S8 family serine peptidase [Acidobacteria bacterium]|nr:S8 family serine peptidase [Acidobacteriota bacterium]